MKLIKDNYKIVLTLLLVLVVVTLINNLTRFYIAWGILYSLVILLSLNASKKIIFMIAALTSLVIISNSVSDFNNLWTVPMNGMTAFTGLWLTTVISIYYKKRIEKIVKEQLDHSSGLEELIVKNSYKLSGPLANMLILIGMIEEECFTAKDLKDLLPLLRQSAAELKQVDNEMANCIQWSAKKPQSETEDNINLE